MHLGIFLLSSGYLFHQAIAVPRILIFTKTSPGAYRHDSIPTAVDVITRLGNGSLVVSSEYADEKVSNDQVKWQSVHSEDDSLWVNGYLKQFDALAFVMTCDKDDGSSSVLSETAKEQMVRYIQDGGGYIGVHVASGTMYNTPFYGRLVGAFFNYHPTIQPVGMKALVKNNPSTSEFPRVFNINEEVYHFRTDPRLLPSRPTILLTNATVYNDPDAASRNRSRSDGPPPHPLAWVRSGGLLDAPQHPLGEGMDDPREGPIYGGGPGRMFYTSLGHLNETWKEPAMQGHVAGGIYWVLQSSSVKSNDPQAIVGPEIIIPKLKRVLNEKLSS